MRTRTPLMILLLSVFLSLRFLAVAPAEPEHAGHADHADHAGHADHDAKDPHDDHAGHSDHDDHDAKDAAVPHAAHDEHDEHDEPADPDGKDAHDDHDDHDSGDAGDAHDTHDEHGDHDEHEDEAPTGPHGGRLLEDGTLRAEVSIFETGVAPQFRVWLVDGARAVDPKAATLKITLRRLGRAPQTITFQPRGDFLLGDQVIEEPHSFDVDVEAGFGGRTLRARYASYEARVNLTAEVAAAGGVTSQVAGSRDLERSLHLTGRIGIPSDRLVELHPRFAGIVRAATGSIGAAVERGTVLAELENSTTLARFPIVSPIDGVLLDRRAVAGSVAAESDVLYIVADLSELWADLDVYASDAALVHAGDAVTLRDDARSVETAAKISYVSPLRDVHTQTTLARAILSNADRRWSPGSFISASLALKEPPAEVAVPPSALQTWKSREAVFIHVAGIWEARPVVVGRRGEKWVELLSGVDAGTIVATGNTFLLRAEIEKAGASHDH